VLNLSPCHPASGSAADERAARLADGRLNRLFLDPLSGRPYPEDVVDDYGVSPDFIRSGDMAAVAVPIDFLGINYYTRSIVRSDRVTEESNSPREVYPNPNPTEMGWEVYPEGLHETLLRVHRDYGFPALYVTENGAAYADQRGPDGTINDPQRVDYLRAHFGSAARAISDGAPLRGYFVWSLIDNFEWAYGYTKRFGIVYVDYSTQDRILKSSAKWYQGVIADNAIQDL
jgi:beta-glucosidase